MTDETKGRLINGALLIGGLAILFASALPDAVAVLVMAILGAGFVVLMAPAWVAQKWSVLQTWLRSR
jgi:hypothetical protein